MAKTRSINTKIWKDDYYGGLSPDYKLVFIYLLTNPSTTISGAYEITKREIAFDTGLNLDCVSRAMERFESDGKINYQDGWIFITNFIKHQSINPKVLIGIRESLKKSPQWVIDKCRIAYDSLSVAFDAFNLNSNLNSNLKEDKEVSNPSPAADADGDEKPSKPKKGCRIPADFYPSPEMIAWTKKNAPDLDIEARVLEFRNYWEAKTGKDATKLDWNKTYQNRILQILDYQTKKGANNGKIEQNNSKPSNIGQVLETDYSEFADIPYPH